MHAISILLYTVVTNSDIYGMYSTSILYYYVITYIYIYIYIYIYMNVLVYLKNTEFSTEV